MLAQESESLDELARRGRAGFADAFRVAAGIALGASLTALVALRRGDVSAGARPASAPQ